MKPRRSSLPVRVYTYACLPPTSHRDLVEEQMARGPRYRRLLLEIELSRRVAYREVQKRYSPQLAELDECIRKRQAVLDQQRTAIKAERRRTKQRSVATKEVATSKSIVHELRALRAQSKALREALNADPRVRAAAAAIDADAQIAKKKARAASGLFYGTYIAIEMNVHKACTSSRDPNLKRRPNLDFIAVQKHPSYKQGVPVSDLLEGRSPLVKIDPLPAATWQSRAGRRAARTFVHFRVATVARQPVLATFPMLMSRPLPADASMTSALIVRRRFARQDVFELQIRLQAASFERAQLPTSATIAALNFGWRVVSDGLRVAMLVDEFGCARELVLPRELMARLDHSEEIQATRARNLDAFRSKLMESLVLVPNRPSWMDDALAAMPSWKAAGRFGEFIIRWRDAVDAARDSIGQFEAMLFGFAEAWRKQDLHLLQWSAHERRRALNHRDEIYRRFAAELSKEYGLVLLEKFDLRRYTRCPNTEDQGESKPQRRNRYRASVSRLRELVIQANRIEVLEAHDLTQTCHRCGTIEAFDAAEELVHTCAVCGEQWDQDVNNCINRIRRHRNLSEVG